jgi:hypothetical protein
MSLSRIDSNAIAANAITSTEIASGAVEQYLNDNSVPLFFRNRIINGDMRIDQRNAGASSNVANATATYFVDRFRAFENTAANVSVQQSTTAPTGFNNSLFVNVFTANATISDNQIATIEQRIEGFNTSNFEWGTAQAKTVTLSFFVRSNLTGTFGGALRNNDDNRSYPFDYTINAANTFQQVVITIPGDTSGTWLSNASTGVKVTWGLAVSSNALGTPNAWAASNFQSATGQTNLLANVNNNFYLSGVQLEVGSVATPFERRPFGTELALCQRYYQESKTMIGYGAGTTAIQGAVSLVVTMRATPSISKTAGTTRVTDADNNYDSTTAPGSYFGGISGGSFNQSGFTGLTDNRPVALDGSSGLASYTFSAEL